ncbi:SCO1664 family protein [Propionicicella superfundia]|uniref:SCO1664 family protein n=1 Tax=Propionicicella superfundia TaxID=348582 RepID=UPI0003F9F048|nr:SCO1664 family protein [Propionicicella superfundia]
MPSDLDLVAAADPREPVEFGELTVVGRLVTATNATFLVETGADGLAAVYKPVAGEAPLWDFPTGTLGRREVAAYRLSAAAGFGVVPFTDLVTGPLGPGSVQCWVDATEDPLVDVIRTDELRPGQFPIVSGVDDEEEPVLVVHADDGRLRRLALFDVLANNADRKGGHVIPAGEVAYGVDHGVCFHHEHKLRTVLWGWAGEPLTDEEAALVEAARQAAPDALGVLGSEVEVAATVSRAEALLTAGSFPHPSDLWPVIPWPPV